MRYSAHTALAASRSILGLGAVEEKLMPPLSLRLGGEGGGKLSAEEKLMPPLSLRLGGRGGAAKERELTPP